MSEPLVAVATVVAVDTATGEVQFDIEVDTATTEPTPEDTPTGEGG